MHVTAAESYSCSICVFALTFVTLYIEKSTNTYDHTVAAQFPYFRSYLIHNHTVHHPVLNDTFIDDDLDCDALCVHNAQFQRNNFTSVVVNDTTFNDTTAKFVNNSTNDTTMTPVITTSGSSQQRIIVEPPNEELSEDSGRDSGGSIGYKLLFFLFRTCMSVFDVYT